MAFEVKGFKDFNKGFSRGLGIQSQFNKAQKDWSTGEENSEIAFYNTDSLWSRWRRGYELFTATQSFLGSTADERSKRGDYRLYFTFQQFPGVFIPARVYSFPSTNQELGEQLVGMRDTDAFSFYKLGLPILNVRYLGDSVRDVYQQVGTTVYVYEDNHGLYVGENVWLDFLTGSGVDETATIIGVWDNVFAVSVSNSASTSGWVDYYVSTSFGDSRWKWMMVQLAYLPTDVSILANERLADRIIEKDPGIAGSYSRTGSTVTATASSAHGMSTGNDIYINFSDIAIRDGRYKVTVLNATQFTLVTETSGTSSGTIAFNRLLRGRRNDDYVGYTITGARVDTNELVFQRKDSYGASTTNNKTRTTVPAHRGFEVYDSNGKRRFLTTELRWQCSCQDFSRRDSYDLYSELTNRRFPRTTILSTKPGNVLQSDNSVSDIRDEPGTFRDLGFVTINNFYKLPKYEDKAEYSVQNLMYYQLRWCKHIYAAMFALQHDEGNQPFSYDAVYQQTGPNIEFHVATGHKLTLNTRIQVDFSDGAAESGEYIVTSVPDEYYFSCVYPFSSTTRGNCKVTNLKKHEYVKSWLLEPNDMPVGEGLKKFEKKFEKEKEALQNAVQTTMIGKQATQWSGQKEVISDFGNPKSIADFDPSVIGMTLTDNIKRGANNKLDRDGLSKNRTNRLTTLINKLFNQAPTLLQDIKIGIINKPLDEYTEEFESGLVDGGTYTNGITSGTAAETSILDANTYSPVTLQDTVVDSNFYINN